MSEGIWSPRGRREGSLPRGLLKVHGSRFKVQMTELDGRRKEKMKQKMKLQLKLKLQLGSYRKMGREGGR